MDNLTHTLIGALIGEATAQAAPRAQGDLPEATRRNLCVTLAAIGSNLPDSDLLYSFFGGKLNYLLHHRGHTHTVLIALLLGAAVFGLMRWWLRRRNLQASSADLRLLAGVLLITPLLHIAMDFGNNYGVHPFWPLDNRWFYGDSIFIIEPLFWAACAPLAFTFRTRPARFIVWLVMVMAIGLVFFTGIVPKPIAAVYSLLVVAMLLVGSKAPRRVSLAAGIGLWVGTTLMFVLTAQAAKSRIEQIAAAQFANSELLDHVVTPMPSNPFCWEIMLIQKETDSVVLRRAMFALAPSLVAADQCLVRSLDLPVTAPLAEVAHAGSPELKWYGQISSPLDRLRGLAQTNCDAEAALRFIRVPWLATIEQELVLGDLRYDREVELGFSEVAITDGPDCPRFVPQWVPPRQDLLTTESNPRVSDASR
jgi:inner membrane protein